MNWKKVAIDDLRDYGKKLYSVRNIKDKIEILEARIYSAKGMNYSSIPSEGGTCKYEDQLLDFIVEKEKLKKNLDDTEMFIKWIETGFNRLSSTDQEILWIFYSDRPKKHIEYLMEKYNCEKSQVYRMKDEALRNFTILMYGVIEN